MPVIPRLGYLTKVREPHTGWVTLSSLGNKTQDESFYTGWVFLPRIGNFTQAGLPFTTKACMFRPQNLPEPKKITRAVPGLPGSFSMSGLDVSPKVV